MSRKIGYLAMFAAGAGASWWASQQKFCIKGTCFGKGGSSCSTKSGSCSSQSGCSKKEGSDKCGKGAKCDCCKNGFRGTVENPCRAICLLRPDGGSNVNGKVQLSCDGKITAIHAEFNGFPPNSKHGFHIHQYGDLSEGCKTAGGHYNPFAKNHGGPNESERHVGDLGNIVADKDGKVVFDLQDNQVMLCGPYSVIGRSLVVHADEDDLGKGSFEDSKTTGHSGSRVACGIIGLAQGDPR